MSTSSSPDTLDTFEDVLAVPRSEVGHAEIEGTDQTPNAIGRLRLQPPDQRHERQVVEAGIAIVGHGTLNVYDRDTWERIAHHSDED